MPLLNINPTRFEKPYILLILGIFIVVTSTFAISSGVLDNLKTTNTGEPPSLTVEVNTLDEAITDLRGIGCNIIESVVIKARSKEALTMLYRYEEFRSIAYRKAMVFKVPTLGATTLVTSDEDDNYHS